MESLEFRKKSLFLLCMYNPIEDQFDFAKVANVLRHLSWSFYKDPEFSIFLDDMVKLGHHSISIEGYCD